MRWHVHAMGLDLRDFHDDISELSNLPAGRVLIARFGSGNGGTDLSIWSARRQYCYL